MAGRLLLLTALATGVMAVGRVAADTDASSLVESLAVIASDPGPYTLSGASRLVSGITLFGAAWYLSRALMAKARVPARLASIAFALSGAFTAASGALAIALGTMASDVAPLGVRSPMYRLAEATSDLRGVTGVIGFALAGLALVLAVPFARRAGEKVRLAALFTGGIGVAMQFIWIDSATVVHRVVGAAFLVWLVAVGALLATGRFGEVLSRSGDDQRILR
jgi:hypothetical protein